MEGTDSTRLIEELGFQIKARYPYFWIVTTEEARIIELIRKIANEVKREAYLFDQNQLWCSINQWLNISDDEDVPPQLIGKNLLEAMQNVNDIAEKGKNYILIFPDFHLYLQNPADPITITLIRQLKYMEPRIKNGKCSIIFISHSNNIPMELKDIISVEIIKMPSRQELEEKFNKLLNETGISIPKPIQEQVISTSLGLTINQSYRLFSLALVRKNRSPEEMVDVVASGKKGIISSSGALDFFSPNEVPKYLAGVEVLKEWLNLRMDAFSMEAEKYGLPKPKGVFLMGIPGTGKSLTAKYIAGTWKMPLIRFDVGAVFGSFVGQSEEQMRAALHLAEAVAPAILWIDEIEKAISSGSGALDAGVSNRILGSFLTWMQEKTAPVFVIATANDISHLPPELMRKGRFDEIFFLDLPNEQERAEIFRVHLKNRNRDPSTFDIEKMVELSEGFVGSEIESAIIEGLYRAFNDGRRDVRNEDIFESLKKTKPLSVTKKDMIEKLREKVANEEAVLASRKPVKLKLDKVKSSLEIDS
jgi:ATP-dependent Zn protease